MRIWSAIREAARARREWKQAVKAYREMCAHGAPPILHVEIRLIDDRYDDWHGMNARGIHGMKTTIPLTRNGERYVRGMVRELRQTCIRQVLAWQRQAERDGEA
jgi:hypothetical protein